VPHIELNNDGPGIRGLMMYRPETAKPLNDLVEALLVAPNSLSRGERELIASYVSKLNDCYYCTTSHGAYAAAQLDGGWDVVDAVRDDPATAEITPKMKALLGIAEKVQQSGRAVTGADVAAARAEGATDIEIHDTVLIAAAFCMYNRYVDGLGTVAPPDRASYDERGTLIVEHGYAALNAMLTGGPPPTSSPTSSTAPQ
jgi:uncharacterized peroxidase-related enzyme